MNPKLVEMFKKIATASTKLFRMSMQSILLLILGARKGAQGTPFEKVMKQMDQFSTTPMEHEEALKILNFSETLPKEKIDPKEIMGKFEKYFEANNPNKGGSFYVQSKIYFAKEELMKDFKKENISKYNPNPKQRPKETEEEKKDQTEEQKSKEKSEKSEKDKKETIKKQRTTKKDKKTEAKSENKKKGTSGKNKGKKEEKSENKSSTDNEKKETKKQK